MKQQFRILMVDDSDSILNDFQKILEPRISHKAELSQVESELFGDDEGFVKQVPHEILASYELNFAKQADEAIAKTLEAEHSGRPFSVIFSDVRMPPGLDGIQLAEQLLKIAPFSEIVIVTAFADYSWDEIHEKFGWTDRLLFLRKPFDGITIKQLTSTLTKKWALSIQARELAANLSSDVISLERQVEDRTARLAQAYKELQDFAHIISHDLRSPLVSIRGFVSELRFDLEKVLQAVDILLPNMDQLQQKAVEKALRENIPEAMEFIDTSTSKMDRLIKGILKLARLGHREFKYEDVSLDELVEQQLEVLGHSIERAGINVISSGLPTLRSDRQALEQVLFHLLSNAVKFMRMDAPGEIKIYADQSEAGQVSFAIADNGRGIDPGDLDLIFEIFQRGGSRDVPGEGMGLTFAKTLLHRLGGNIRCTSTLGQGSVFLITLPKMPPEELLNASLD